MNQIEQLQRHAQYLQNAVEFYKVGLGGPKWINTILEEIQTLEDNLQDHKELIEIQRQIRKDLNKYKELEQGSEPYQQIKDRVLGHAA